MITEEQLKIWIISKGGVPFCTHLDVRDIQNGYYIKGKSDEIYFYKHPESHMMLLCGFEQVGEFNEGKIPYDGEVYETTISDIISEVRDYLISKI
jgi:hypothetical protein